MKRSMKLLAIAALAALAASPASAKTLKAAYFVSPKHPIGLGYARLGEELKRLSKGALTLRIFPGESLLGAKAISDGIRDGVTDMGHVVMTYTPAYYPHGVVINDLSMVGENDMAAGMAVTELMLLGCPSCLEEAFRQNQIPLAGTSTPPYVVIANGDFNGLDKIKLKKLRAAGSLWDRFCRSVGAVAVNMPTAGMYEAMSRGTLDGVLYSLGGLKSHGLGDIAKQVILLNTGSFRAALVVSLSKSSWKALTIDERKIMLKAAAATSVYTTIAFAKSDQDGMAVAKAKNIPVVKPEAALLKARNDFVEADTHLTIKNAKEKLKLTDAEEFVANYKTLYAKYEKLVAPIANDEGKLAEMLYKEVYAKIDPATFAMQ